MLTLIPIDDDRFDITFEDEPRESMDKAPTVVGYVKRGSDGLWIGYRVKHPDSQSREGDATGYENPLDAAKLVVEDYERRTRLHLERTIARMEKDIAEMPFQSSIKPMKERLLAGLKTKLGTGDY